MDKIKLCAEIGINFAYGNSKNDFLENVFKLIDISSVAGCHYVKFQKRDPESCVPVDERQKPKNVPWRSEPTTYMQYKLDIELDRVQYDAIDEYCKARKINWFASVWDKKSVDFLQKYKSQLPDGSLGRIMKIPSAKINDLDLVEYAKNNSDFLLISTGMSTQEEIDLAIEKGLPDVVFHTNSSYPASNSELNLDYLTYLNDLSGRNGSEKEFEIGYSGHEFGLITTIAATLLGANWIERHITLDRTLWGSDQMASVEPQGLIKLAKSINDIQQARGGYGPRKIFPSELTKRKTLRG